MEVNIMKIKMTNKNDLISELYKETHSTIHRYIYFNCTKNHHDIEDLTSEAFKELLENKSYNNKPYQEYRKILWGIIKNKKKKFLEDNRKQNQYANIEEVKAKDKDEEERINYLLREKILIKEYEKKNIQEKEKRRKHIIKVIANMRRVISIPYRSFQEAILLYLTPSYKELRKNIKKKFPLLIKRYKKRKIHYLITTKKERKLSKKFYQSYGDFIELSSKIANEVNINDEIGIKAIEILLLSDNPWSDWNLFIPNKKEQEYSSFNEDNKLIRKKYTKRAYPNFPGGFLYLLLGSKIKDFINFFI